VTQSGGSLSGRVAVVAAGRVATTASIFVVNAVLARTWSLPDVGRFSAVWIVGNTLAPLFLLGLPTALLYHYPRRAAGVARRDLTWQATLVLLASAVLVVALLALAGGPLSAWVAGLAGGGNGSGEIGPLLWPFLPYVFALVAAGHVEAVLVAAERPAWPAALALGTAAGLVAVAVAARGLAWDVGQTLAALSAVGVLRALTGWGLLGLAHGLGRPAWTGTRELLGYAARVGLNDTAGSLSRAVDRGVVVAFLGTADLALYHVGAIEVPVSLALAAVVTVLVPEVSRLSAEGRTAEVAALFRGAVGRLALFILPLFCFLFVHADRVIDIYLPEAYERTTEVFRLFLLALPLRCAVYNPILVGTGKAHWALYGSLGDLVLNLTLSLAFVHWLLAARAEWALFGPAAATVLSTWVQVGLLVALLARSLDTGVRQVVPWMRLGRLLAVGALAAAASAWLVEHVAYAPAGQLLLAAALFAPRVALPLRWWHRPDWDELIALGKLLRRRGAAA
jgi:O-antigen/teichoic acid export membrane protein